MKLLKLKIHEWLFLLAALLVLTSVWWIDGVGFPVWTVAKISYFTGIVFFVFDIFKENKSRT